jgi:hypothetical protein
MLANAGLSKNNTLNLKGSISFILTHINTGLVKCSESQFSSLGRCTCARTGVLDFLGDIKIVAPIRQEHHDIIRFALRTHDRYPYAFDIRPWPSCGFCFNASFFLISSTSMTNTFGTCEVLFCSYVKNCAVWLQWAELSKPYDTRYFWTDSIVLTDTQFYCSWKCAEHLT